MNSIRLVPTQSSMQQAFISLFNRELRLGFRRPAERLAPVGFALVVVTLFSFGGATQGGDLASIATSVIWTTALLSMVISVETMFTQDFEDGTLEQLLLSPQALTLLVTAKVLARWFFGAVPLILISPLLGIMLNLDPSSLPALALSLLLGTPTLYLFGAFGASLLVGQRRGTAMLALLALPLCIPVLIFASGLVHLASQDLSIENPLSLLTALLVLAITFLPVAIAVVLAGNAANS